MGPTRRDLIPLALLAAAVGTARNSRAADEKSPAPDHDMSAFPPSWHGSEKIAFLAYPQFTALDLVGPHYMLGNLMGAQTFIVAKTRDPVSSDMKLTIVPDRTFDDCPADLDIICVPGGTAGTLAAMGDDATIAFLKDRGAKAKYITSVCTGSLVLGAAGLLTGYKATSHWVTRDVLTGFGAEPVNARVVIDRNRITGGGVTAGLDFGLTLVSKLRDPEYAKALQLLAEYQPTPPFDSGTPERASSATTKMLAGMFEPFIVAARQAAETAVQRL